MFKIQQAQLLAPAIMHFVIEAPRIARKQESGQFVIVRIGERGERIPLTIENSDPAAGTISIVVQAVGKTTHMLHTLKPADTLADVVGPLGKPSEINKFGTAVVLGWGVGTGVSHGGGAEARGQRGDFHCWRSEQKTGDSGAGNACGERYTDRDHR